MTTTLDRLSAILMQDYKLPADHLTLDTTLESLGIDSLGTIELLWSVEDAFRIKLPSDPVKLPTLGDVVHYIDGLIAEQGGASVTAPPGESALSAK